MVWRRAQVRPAAVAARPLAPERTRLYKCLPVGGPLVSLAETGSKEALMEPQVEVTFPEGGGLEARYKSSLCRLETEGQTSWHEGPPPSPFDMFVMSIATCTAANVLAFMEHREIDPSAAKLVLHRHTDREIRMITRFTVELVLPEGFPEKYRDAIARAAEACAVTRHILESPEFETVVSGG